MMVSIVLPVYNRIARLEEGVRQLKAELNKQECIHEIIIVDDGSVLKDDIRAIAIDHGCRYLRNDPNAGKGMAVKRGVLAAEGEMIIFMDGDFPFHLSVIPGMIKALQQHSIVIGDRTLPGSSYMKETVLLRKTGSRVLSTIISRFYIKGIRDSQCGIKGFKSAAGKAIFSKITQNRFSFDVELLFIATRNNFKVERLPVMVYEQDGSSVNVFRDGLGMIVSLFNIIINNVKGKYRIDE